ncbi:FAD-dependent oxidoreductase, partial [Staphylococcus aureus]|uniref:FAD-dependent oxidoreductase n=1 Tax=Staphylococcus aureus TaxID=1280 RepID=UPI00164313BD
PYITQTLKNHENITLINQQINPIPHPYTIIPTPPLTTQTLPQQILHITGKHQLYFYHPPPPIIQKQSIHIHKLYLNSPYHKPQPPYLNSPITHHQFNPFYHPLLQPQLPPVNSFQKQ